MTGQNTKRRSSPRRANSPSFLGRGKPGEEPDAPVDGTVEEAHRSARDPRDVVGPHGNQMAGHQDHI